MTTKPIREAAERLRDMASRGSLTDCNGTFCVVIPVDQIRDLATALDGLASEADAMLEARKQ